MIQKSKKMIMFAVIAVIIVVVPISFYEFPSKPVPDAVYDGFSEFTWRDNFTTSIGCKEAVFPYDNETNTSAIILFHGYPESTLTMALYSIECSNTRPSNYFIFGINVSGALTSNFHPKNLVISENIRAYSSEKGGFFNTSNPYVAQNCFLIPYWIPEVNLSIPNNGCFIPGTGALSSEVNFLNDSYLTKSTIYHFDLYRCKSEYARFIYSDLCFFPESLNISYYLTFTAELTGLSKPVYTQVELIIQNVQE